MVRLYLKDLLSKWGFSDGDQVSDWIFEKNPDLSLSLSIEQKKKVLITAVERFLIPELKKNYRDVKYTTKGLIHNPIRLTELDDLEINWMKVKDYEIIPEYIDIPDSEIFKIIKEITKEV
jgi:hypothetical protein